MQSAIEYAAIPTINLTPLFLVTNPLTNSSQSDTLQAQMGYFRCPVNHVIILSSNSEQTNLRTWISPNRQ